MKSFSKTRRHDWRLPAFEDKCPSPIDWARMAAYLDGEGSILINTQKMNGEPRGFYLRITVANTDVRLPIWLKETFGGGYKDANTDKYYEGKNWKRSYHWGTSAHRAAWILYNCLPYFVMKSEQAQIGIQLQDSLTRNDFRGRGNTLTQEEREKRKGLKGRLLVLKAKGIKGVPVPSGPVAATS